MFASVCGERVDKTPAERGRGRIQAARELLSSNPRTPAATQLVRGAGEWRIRTGDYRIVYEIEDEHLVVLVLRMGHRSEISNAH